MEYKLILKLAGLALGTVIIEQILQKSGKQTEATIITFVCLGLMLGFSIQTIIDLGNGATQLFNLGS